MSKLDLSKIENYYTREVFKQVIAEFDDLQKKFNEKQKAVEEVKQILDSRSPIKSILVESTPDVPFSKASILFDEDSILYSDDGAL